MAPRSTHKQRSKKSPPRKKSPPPTIAPGADDHLHHVRHSLAHVLAAAILELFPNATFGVGPVIEHGFYYDVGLPRALTPQDLPKIEKRMRVLIAKRLDFERRELPFAETVKFFQQLQQPFKVELVKDLQKHGTTYVGEGMETTGDAATDAARAAGKATVYTLGRFHDLCRGGHVESTKEIDPQAFRLTSIAGAYWRGDEKNPQLQRIYGVAFASKGELDAHLTMLAEAAAHDHRKLGKDLDLFSFHSEAPGAVFWHPRGTIIWNELERLLRTTLTAAGYQEVQTPLMVKPEVFERSGHLSHYKENMFRVLGKNEEFYLKPMNCPESAIIFSTRNHSYRDLPVRFAEFGRVHRNELSGTLGGLFRVRQFTQDDGHLYCTPEQLEKEITNILKLSKGIYKLFRLTPSFYLSTKPKGAMGDAGLWKQAEDALVGALTANKLPFERKEGEGTFYAPKIDIDITDSLGRRWQLCTIQADLVMVPSLPGVGYIDAHGEKRKPVVVHRAIFGSFERFIGILLEHYAGDLPTWLAPVQVQFVPVGAKHVRPATKLAAEWMAEGVRVHVDDANETVGYKIRRATKQKVPYLLVFGDKEAKGTQLSVRVRGSDQVKKVAKKRFLQQLVKEIEERA